MNESFTPTGQLNTPVLFLVFNRPDTTAQVFEAIRQARPPRLYVAADGPREGREGEAERVARVREIATAVDWPCEVKTLFRDENLGCKHAVSGAIDWFFRHEEQGIILEDDCLPHPDFFLFCETLLERYANDERVWMITGNNFQDGQRCDEASYYFSKYNHIWGWASWRRAWSHYDVELSFWPEWRDSDEWARAFSDSVERGYWLRTFNSVQNREVDTWDYQWTACVWKYGGLTATPNVNLVSNIGFGEDATHTTSSSSDHSEIPFQPIGELIHPTSVAPDTSADRYVFDNNFGGRNLRFPMPALLLPARTVRFALRTIKRKFGT